MNKLCEEEELQSSFTDAVFNGEGNKCVSWAVMSLFTDDVTRSHGVCVLGRSEVCVRASEKRREFTISV